MTPEKAGSLDGANREAWLQNAAKAMTPWLNGVEGVEVPPMWVSVGWPGGRAPKSTVGQCWPTSSSSDGIGHVFISPLRGSEQSVDVLATLLHEMIHLADDCVSGHRKDFIRIGKAVGFLPKWTSSANRSEELQERLQGLAERLGPIPHGAIIGGRAADTPKKQGTRMLKVECGSCGYIVRTSQKWVDFGLPTCPCGSEMGLA